LYSFVRLSDDYAKADTDAAGKVTGLEKQYQQALKVEHFDPTTHTWDDPETRIIKNMMRLTQRYKFDPAWVQSFFAAVKEDLKPKARETLDHSLEYVHGSAEVVALMMAKILKLPEEAWEYAKLQGRAIRWMDFVRDIKDYTERGHLYFPESDLKKFGLTDLKEETARANPEAFKKFMHLQIKRYRDWQAEAEKGHELVPKRFRIPVQTVVETFNWTADVIEKNPFVVYKKKVRPVSRRVLARGLVKKTKQASKTTAQKAKQLQKYTFKQSKKLYKKFQQQ
jgi:phytoene synthase